MDAVSGKVLGLVGALMVAFGAFLPVLRVPLRGSETLTGGSFSWVGFAIIACGALAALLVLIALARHALWPGIGALGLLAVGYMRASGEIAASQARMGDLDLGSLRELGGNLSLRAVARDLVVSEARLEWGWAVPVLGAVLVIVGAWLARRRPVTRPG